MTVPTLSFLFGALLVLVGILGGGFEIKEIKIPTVPVRGRVLASIVGLTFIGLAIWPSDRFMNGGRDKPTMSDMEWDTDRFGADYTSFPLPRDNPKQCEDACRSDEKCRAWTYVKPNTIQGPMPICYLKGAIPPSQDNTCCVSGTKSQ
jgi:hypothetical protein